MEQVIVADLVLSLLLNESAELFEIALFLNNVEVWF
jgi:hypothetical protein